MITFKEILNNNSFAILNQLKNEGKYFAHIRGDVKETLLEHTNLVMKYFDRLINENTLEILIDKLIEKDVVKVFSSLNYELQNLVKKMFVGTIYFHDFGKINENFQREKMLNLSFPKINNGISSDHSILSAYLFLAYFSKIIFESSFPEMEKYYLYMVSIILSHSIFKHHGTISDAFEYNINETLLQKLDHYYNLFIGDFFIERKYLTKVLQKNFENFKSDYTDDSAAYILLKLNSSLLTASDYLATNEFMIGCKIEDFGILTSNVKSKIIKGIENIPYNKTLYENFDYYTSLKFENLQEFSKDSLNQIRQKLSSEVITTFRNNKNKKLFYIEAPTGSGKTNLSLLLISELLKTRSDITKIFYVFPFISLITQNIIDFRNYLSLRENEIIQIHSKAPFDYNKEDDFNGHFGQNYIDALFVNFPFVLLSHIKFFNSLISNDKEDNYLLYRVANSVVIIDELQSYTPSEWDKLYNLINEFSESLNITFVLMSATLPKISKLLKETKDKFVYLVNEKKNYFNNPNLANRVKYNFDYLDGLRYSFSNESFADIVLKHSEDYYSREGHVHTLIEFITKKSAKSFYEFILPLEGKGYDLIFIDGTVLEPRRIEIIEYLKSDRRRDKIIIVATQVIEAGLNLDMDIGFKDTSILDAEEQFAGRINRNASKLNSIVYLFNSGNAQHVYGKDLRYTVQKNIKKEILYEILKEKDFDKYYSHVFEKIINYNNDKFAENISTFLNSLRTLKYWEVRKSFRLIDDKTIPIFVPLCIKDNHFSSGELVFLKNNKIFNGRNSQVNGANIFELYSHLISQKGNDIDFLRNKAELKILSAIMSKFVFNSYLNNDFFNILKHYGEESHGYFYLYNWEKVYSYENGLKADLETDCNFL